MPQPAAPRCGDDPLQPAGRVTLTRHHGRPCALDLSRSRTHYAALDILEAYKLSGNFHSNLGAVLKDMGVFNMLSYQVEPNAAFTFPDRRHVVFTPAENASGDMFDHITAAIKVRIGFDAPWWLRQFRRLQPRAAGDQMCRPHY
jgi:hypothetical protein